MLVVVFGLGTELVRGMGKEADFPLAVLAGNADSGTIFGRVEPVLENAMGVLASVALGAGSPGVAECCTDHCIVAESAGIPSLGLLPPVSVGTLSPVVAPCARATFDLVLIHPELVRCVYFVLDTFGSIMVLMVKVTMIGDQIPGIVWCRIYVLEHFGNSLVKRRGGKKRKKGERRVIKIDMSRWI